MLLTIAINGCVSNSVPGVLDENLPTVENIKTISATTSVGLEWPSYASNEAVTGFYLYRSTMDENEMKLVANIKDKYATHYVDDKLAPESTYKYMIKTYGKNGISQSGPVAVATTAKLLDSVPYAQAIYGLPERIKLIWRPHPDLRVSSYVIERSTPGKGNWSKRAEVKGRLSAEYIDEVGSNESYEYRIFVKTSDGMLSRPSQILSATTKALPAGIDGLSASQNEPKKIILNWNGTTNDDFSTYRIYSSRFEIAGFTLLNETTNTTYEDLINENGAKRYYKITVVDKTGLESSNNDKAVLGKTLAAPEAPIINSVSFDGSAVNISWSSNDTRIISYYVQRSEFLGFAGSKKFENISDTNFMDSNVERGKTYYYQVIGIDEFGIESNPSDKKSIEIK